MVIPKGWEQVVLGELISKKLVAIQTGPFGTVLGASEYVEYGIPVVSVREIRNGFIKVFAETPRVSSHTILRIPQYVLKHNDLVFARKGSVERCALIPDDDTGYFLGSDAILLRFISNTINPIFMLYCFHSFSIKNYLLQNSYGTTMAGLNEKILARIPLLFPGETKEQTAIAEALSDTDSLITSLEKLITKKKAIKQGAMQELLTGKTRLPGFDGEWTESILENYLQFEVGYPFRSEYFNQEGYGIRLVKNRDLKSDDQVYYSTEQYDPSFIVQSGDILVGMDGDFLPCIWSKGIALLNQRIGRIKVRSNLNHQFTYYILIAPLLELQYGTGATTVKHLSHTDIEALKLFIPLDVAEQAAIASILSDMDAEIEQLEKKLAKYCQIKQGMMQELLTGRIRFVEPVTKAENVADVEPVTKSHNPKYDDAIAISAIVNAFYDDRFILGRVKVQKLLYLLRRKQDADVSGFQKKAAGPYNEKVRYNGGESIAIKENYINRESSSKGSKFSKGVNISAALKYIGHMQADIDWLLAKFRYYNTNKNTNNLEVLATVDMAACELHNAGKIVSVNAVKEVIRSNKDWVHKLEKEYFSDAAIQQAINESRELFS